MLIGVPETTAYDLNFRLLGIPIRVHPLFWLVTLVLGAGSRQENPSFLLIWVACVFVSILVHEFGHALAAILFGARPAVVLYGMGGLCYYPESDQQSSWQRIFVLICGPGAGFLLAAAMIGAYIAMGAPTLSPVGDEFYNKMLLINIVWGILNLFPIWPMDGGQITVVFLSMINRRNGRRWGHTVSLVVAGLLGLLVVLWLHDMWLTFLCGYFAFLNYQALQTIHDTWSHYGGDDPADWWKR